MRSLPIIIVFMGISAICLGASSADLNNDGKVDTKGLAVLAEEWLQTGIGTYQDLLLNAQFSRNSIAFLNGQEYAADAPRKTMIAVCGVSDCQIHDLDDVIGDGLVDLSPMNTSGGYIYAKKTDSSNIYRSQDGITWERTSTGLTGVYRIYGTASGAILVLKYVNGHMTLYRSTTGGSDLRDDHLPPPAMVLPRQGSECASMDLYNFHQALNGTICITEYGVPSVVPLWPRSRIYRSTDDGLTFTQVYNDPNDVYHSHRIMKHEATGRWVDVYGDGPERNKVVKSDDDGQTWSTLDPQPDNHFQPTEFLDYGHPTDLLYGADDYGFVGTFNVLTRKITPLYSDGDRYCPFVFALYYYNGVFYAGTFSLSSGSPRRTAILVSSDLVHWAVYHQFRNNEQEVNRFLGVFGGKMQVIVTLSDFKTWRRFSFTPATVDVVNSLCLDPGTTNMLDNIGDCSVEGNSSGWDISGGTSMRISSDALHGSESLRVYGNSDSDAADSSYRNVMAGKTYNSRIWLKANGQNVYGHVNWYVSGATGSGSAQLFTLSQDQWTEIVLNPVTIAPGGTKFKIHVRPRDVGNPGPYDILIDAAQYEQGPPTRWQVGGTPRANEYLSKTVDFPESWTNVILWAPECRSEWYAGSPNQYIKTWYLDDNNYMELYFNPSNSTFCLQPTVGGVAQTALRTSSYSFYRNGVIEFAVQCDNSTLSLSVSAAAPFEHVVGTGVNFLSSATLTSKTGDHNGENLMSCTLIADKLYEGILSDSQLSMSESIISAEGTELKADLNNDGIVNLVDLAILSNEWQGGGLEIHHNSQYPPALFVEDFNDKDEGGWSSPQTMTNTTEFSTCGKTSIMVSTAGSNENRTQYAYLYKDYGTGFEKNWDKCSFRFRYYIPPHMAYMPQCYGFEIVFYKDGGDVNKAVWDKLPHAPGWNDIEIPASGLLFFGDMHDMSVVRRFLIGSWIPAGVTDANGEFSGPSNPWYVVCDCLEVWADDTQDKGAVIFQFDDGYLSSYEKGIKYLASKGLPSMMYVSGEAVGTGSGDNKFCTWEQLDEAAGAGCIICPHSQSDTPVDTVENVRSFYEWQIAYMRNHGHLSGLSYWAIPGGQVKWWDTQFNPVLTPSQKMDIALEYFVNIRGTARYWIDVDDYDGNGGYGDNQRPWGQTGAIPCRPKNVHWASIAYVETSESLNDAKIERVSANKGLLIFMAHRIGSSNPNDPSEAVYQAAVDKCLSEGLKVITLEDVVMGRNW